MDTALRNAIFISAAIHFSAIGTSLCNINIVNPQTRQKDSIVVDYVVVKEPEKIDLPRREVIVKTIETPRLEMKQKLEMKPPVSPTPAIKKTEAAKEAAHLAKKQAKIRSTKDYVSYYQMIREKIRQRLKDNYKNYYKEGDVHLTFDLNANGLLAELYIDRAGSTIDQRLLDIAISSMKEAAPFSPFPKALDLPRMSFNLTVSFKKE